MFEIDRAKFGAFVAELRKEKGLTQKELAEKINISDKAVSKWETGNSIPDISLLVPLAEILGVSVTELLECRRMEIQDNLDKVQTDHLIKKAIELSAEENDKIKRKNFIVYLLCAFFSIVSNYCIYRLHRMGGLLGTFNLMPMMMVSLFAIGFGAYFWIFIKDKLPSYYDENDISVYVDGILHMNMPGVVYNNYNSCLKRVCGSMSQKGGNYEIYNRWRGQLLYAGAFGGNGGQTGFPAREGDRSVRHR